MATPSYDRVPDWCRHAGGRPSWDWSTRRGTATPPVAERLGIEPGDPVMQTDYRFEADGDPVTLSTSWEPLALTEGTPIERPEESPVTGVIPRFDLLGIEIDRVDEDVTARAPSPHEASALQVPQGVPVMAIQRTYFAGGRPVETADIVVSADVYTLSFVVPIPPRQP